MGATVRDQGWLEGFGTFLAESREMLDTVEPGIVGLEGEQSNLPDTKRKIDAIFRLFHSFKGGAASFDLNVIRNLTHQAESLLDLFCKKPLTNACEHVDLWGRCCDFLCHAVDHVQKELTDESLEVEANILISAVGFELSRKSDGNMPPVSILSEIVPKVKVPTDKLPSRKPSRQNLDMPFPSEPGCFSYQPLGSLEELGIALTPHIITTLKPIFTPC
jgi:chemotaxis protein histidine kinase CheA